MAKGCHAASPSKTYAKLLWLKEALYTEKDISIRGNSIYVPAI